MFENNLSIQTVFSINTQMRMVQDDSGTFVRNEKCFYPHTHSSQ